MNAPDNPPTAACSLDRRHFLAAAGALAAGSALARPASAAEPVRRHGGPHMKLSLAAYSFNRQLRRNGDKKPAMTLEDFIDFCAELDLDGTELTGYYFPDFVQNAQAEMLAAAEEAANREETPKPRDLAKVMTDQIRRVAAYLNSLKHRCFRLGLDISGTAIGNDFALPEGEARQKQLSMTRQWIDHAAAMGAPVIRIFAGRVPRGDSEEAAIERCVAGINESLEYAATKGVFLALENHGGITATPEQMLRIVNGVKDSTWFGVNFDSGNFRTDDPYRDLAKIAPYAINAQVKVAVAPSGKKEAADLKRIIGILKEADYRGYVVLEYEEPEDPKKMIPRYIAELRELIAP